MLSCPFEESEAFAEYFTSVFKSNDAFVNKEEVIHKYLDSPLQLDFPLRKFKPSEVCSIITHNLNPHTSPGCDSITGKILKELPRKVIIFLTFLFNAILRLEHKPLQFKRAQLIVVPKPGKPSPS
uniref:Reverse transcriptase domain-containing protein n=1 Tax=Homalodisca liturata TaxID=320908 RepID=A0A1B6IY88_9HEMI